MNRSPGDAAQAFGYAEALDLVHRGRLDEARERARLAAASATAGPRAGSLSDLMAAALTELLAALPENGFAGFADEHEARTAAIIEIALAAKRPGWAAAARAIGSVGLVNLGRPEEALQELAKAEHELAAEIQAGKGDPWGKPQGIAAGHNNIGYAYLLLQAYELALPHLTAAMEISRWGYGPELSVQARMDVFNLGELHLRWALVADAAGDVESAEHHTTAVTDAVAALSRTPGDDPAGPWSNAAEVLHCGVRSVTAPNAVTSDDLALLQRTAQGEELTFLHSLAWHLLARVARLLNDSPTASQAADRLADTCGSYDPMLAWVAAREAELATAAVQGHLAESRIALLQEGQQRERERGELTAALRQRIAEALSD